MVSSQDIHVYGVQREDIEADLMAEIALLYEREQHRGTADNGPDLTELGETALPLEEAES